MNTAQDFAYWLQGFVELQDSDSISDKQWLIIKDHLKLVFDKVTPEHTPDRGITFSSPEITFGPQTPFDYGKISDLACKQSQQWPYVATC